MDYFGIKEISTSVDSTDNFKAFYASGSPATIQFISKSGDPASVVIPAGTILPIFSTAVIHSGTSSSGKIFGLY